MASPAALVATVQVWLPPHAPPKVPDGSPALAGAVKVTLVPTTGWLVALRIWTSNALGKAVRSVWLWLLPPTIVMVSPPEARLVSVMTMLAALAALTVML